MFRDDEAFCLLEEVPLRVPPDDAGRRQDRTGAQLRATLISVHAGGGGITVAWVRRRRNDPVEVLLGGDPALGIGDGDQVRPLYPPGSRGRRRSPR
jgi:hypothetical protein